MDKDLNVKISWVPRKGWEARTEDGRVIIEESTREGLDQTLDFLKNTILPGKWFVKESWNLTELSYDVLRLEDPKIWWDPDSYYCEGSFLSEDEAKALVKELN